MYVPELGNRVPRWGNRFSRWIGRTVLRLFGWGFEGTVPNHGKMVLIGAPHTTAWDFPVAIMMLMALGIHATWLGVDWMFHIPFMRWIGGVPIDRSRRHDVVGQAIERFAAQDQFILALAPEGSRRKVVPWKSGFYHIASGAGVPLFLVAIDWLNRKLRMGPSFMPSGDLDADMEKIRSFYADYLERYPENFGI